MAKIRVVGVGGAGCNTINRIRELGIEGAELIAVNTDAQDLLATKADKKILIGKKLTRGLGAGSNPKIGEQAAREQEDEIKKALEGTDLLFLTAGLGGGTGSGAAPVIAELAKKMDILTIAVVTLPFKLEGAHRWQNAMEALAKIEGNVDALIVIPNDKLLEIAPNLPINLAFKLADEILANAIKNLTEVINKTGLVNIDFADIRTIIKDSGYSLIGFGEADGNDRAKRAVEQALNNPLIDADPKGAERALLHIIGGKDFTLQEAEEVLKYLHENLAEDAKLIWGAHIDNNLDSKIKVMIVLAGVKSKYVEKLQEQYYNLKKPSAKKDDNLGIEFID
jgi:cell division protein FtsZ